MASQVVISTELPRSDVLLLKNLARDIEQHGAGRGDNDEDDKKASARNGSAQNGSVQKGVNGGRSGPFCQASRRRNMARRLRTISLGNPLC